MSKLTYSLCFMTHNYIIKHSFSYKSGDMKQTFFENNQRYTQSNQIHSKSLRSVFYFRVAEVRIKGS